MHTINRPGPPVLPKERVITGRPFQTTGVNYTGAISVKDATNGETFKVYIALFTCMVTRAVYLQVASDLSAETFLNVFRQFAAVCSLPRFIISDQGTNLCETAKFFRGLSSEAPINGYMQENNIEWKFIHVRSPWEGGFYE